MASAFKKRAPATGTGDEVCPPKRRIVPEALQDLISSDPSLDVTSRSEQLLCLADECGRFVGGDRLLVIQIPRQSILVGSSCSRLSAS